MLGPDHGYPNTTILVVLYMGNLAPVVSVIHPVVRSVSLQTRHGPPGHSGALRTVALTHFLPQLAHGLKAAVNVQWFLSFHGTLLFPLGRLVDAVAFVIGSFVGEPRHEPVQGIPDGKEIDANVFALAGINVDVNHVARVLRQLSRQKFHAVVALGGDKAEVAGERVARRLAHGHKANPLRVGDFIGCGQKGIAIHPQGQAAVLASPSVVRVLGRSISCFDIYVILGAVEQERC